MLVANKKGCVSMKKLISALLIIVCIINLVGCGIADNQSASPENYTFYPVECEVELHSKKQNKYLTGDCEKVPFGVKGEKELSHPEAVVFSWPSEENADGKTEYTVSISKSEDMKKAQTYSTTENSLSVYNLEIATDYYWTVSYDGETSDVKKFSTSSAAPRNIYVDGITNVRDIGGWVTEDGTRTNQGLIYRCGRLNESKDNGCAVIITEDGKKEMLDGLGIKTEIDLRQIHTGETGGITESPIGESVNYISCPMDWTGDLHGENNAQLLNVFEVLSDEENYPMIIHCSVGTDRTGMFAFLINALLGVSEEDLCRDYLFSNFGAIGSKRKINQLKESVYYTEVMNAQGNTLSEKAYNYLADLGVPTDQLDSVISILKK